MGMQIADAATTRMLEDNIASNAYAQDKHLRVKFYLGAIENKAKSVKEGRPIFDEIEMIQILVPGQGTERVERPAWEQDYARFPGQYKNFKSGLQDAETGTPLTVWPAIKANQVAELNARGVRTVEQLAGMADIDAQKMMGMNSLRQKAKDFIEAARGAAPLTAMRAELEASNAQLALLQAQMTEVLARDAAKATPAPPQAVEARPQQAQSRR